MSQTAPYRRKADLPTPALLLDRQAFDHNLRVLAEQCRSAGCAFRPHAKTHKCPEIARRQLASGAIGISVATVPEAEAMAEAGLDGILLTSPIVEPGKIVRMVRLRQRLDRILLAVAAADEIDLLDRAAREVGVVVDVLIDLDIGDCRTGVAPGAPALALAREIARRPGLRLRGLQAYAGHASHVVGFSQRQETSRAALAAAVATLHNLKQAGFHADILSVGSTGTYNIDSHIAEVTELQCGSYIFMDVDYHRIGGRTGVEYTDFRFSLSVLTTVVNANRADRVTVDAGIKSLATDVPDAPVVKGRPDLTYEVAGDEFGFLKSETSTALPRLGQRLELVPPHCDPTVNLFDQMFVVDGDSIEAVWPIVARKSS